MDWIELSTTAEAEAVEAVAELFGGLGHGGGVAIDEPLAEGAEPGRVELDPNGLFTVKTYLSADEQAAERIERAERALWHLSQLRRIGSLRVARIAEEDWAEAWKEFFFVQRIGERLVVKPSWRDYQAGPSEVVLELDPGMAFGTGLHPTTRMCLLACERLVRLGMRVMDLGTGSGILAMAAAKLGAAEVVALDLDTVAVQVATKNVAMNGLEGRVRVLEGSIGLSSGAGEVDGPEAKVAEVAGGTGGEGFDLVLANIIARVIAELAPALREAVLPDGLVVASGIIAEREDEARSALESAGLRVEEVMVEGDWRTLVCRRG